MHNIALQFIDGLPRSRCKYEFKVSPDSAFSATMGSGWAYAAGASTVRRWPACEAMHEENRPFCIVRYTYSQTRRDPQHGSKV